jgi:hypothetical protein
MANPIIKIKRSAVAGKIPTTTSLELGELAINTYDGKVYIEQDQGAVGVGTTIIIINPWSVGLGSTAYNTYFTAGSVGIGTTNPTEPGLSVLGKVQIHQDSSSNNRIIFRGQPGSSYRWNIDNYSSANEFRIFREDDATSANGSVAVSISTTGTVTANKFSGDGSLLTGIVASGSGVVIKDDGSTVGTATTIDFGSNLSASFSSGTATISLSNNASISGILTADQVYTSNNGNGTNIRIGDDAWLGDINVANTTRLSGAQDGTKGFIVFGNSNAVALGRTGTGPLYYGGNFEVAGVVTASSFNGNASSATYASTAGVATYATNAGVATALQNVRTFEITGDVVASAISFDGTGNVSLAATIQPNSVGLGTDTTGDYVTNITGTSNQITVTSGTGEGSTPTLSIPSQFTAPQDVTVTRDLQVNRNLNVTGNITIGGTSATLFTTELKVSDPDLVLGFRTDANNNDVSNDTTANHGGIAIASTEGSPLVSLYNPGIGESTLATYKKIMWFKSGSFTGLNTDAWLINYAVGIGSTQFPVGTRLAAGNVQFTENDLAVVRNVNSSGVSTLGTVQISSGIITATSGVVTYYGDGSKLSNIISGVSISTNTTNQAQLIPYVISTGSTTGFGVSASGLVFNPSTDNLGIGTTNPTTSLTVAGNTANILIGKQYTNANAITLNGSTAAADYNILSTSTNNLVINRPSGKTILFAQADSTHATFDSSNNLQLNSGSLSIGNFAPSYAIDAGAASLNKAGRVGSIIFGTAGTSYGVVGYNAKPSGLNAWQYDVSDFASWIQFLSGGHVFYRTLSGIAGNGITPLESGRFDSSGNLLIGSSSATGTASQPLQVTGGGYISTSTGIGTTNPTQILHVQGNARITGGIYDSNNNVGTAGSVLSSTGTGLSWIPAAAGGGGSGAGTTFFGAKFDTNIDSTLYIQPTGTLDIVGVGTTTTQITTFPSGSSEYIIHSIHVTNISNGDAEITGGFLLNSRAVPASISVSIGQSGRAGFNTVTVGSASSIVPGMAVIGTGNIGETTGIGSTAGFQFNTYVTSVDGTVVSFSKPLSGRIVGVATFIPTSKFASRLPVPVGSAVELLKQPMILNALDSIVLQSTGAGTGVGSTSTAAISQTSGSNLLTVTAGAAITNFIAAGQLIQGTGSNTGIQTNTFVGVGYTPGQLTVPMTRPATSTLASQILSFTEVVTPQDGALQATIVYQTTADTSFQSGTGTVVGIVTLASQATSPTLGITSTVPLCYYGTGNTYPSTIQSIRVTNISDGSIYPGGDYPVWVGIGNSDTVFSWLAYNMIIPKNSSIELCEAPKRLGIGQSIFAYSSNPGVIDIQVAGRQKTS